MCKRICKFERQLSSYWQNIKFSQYCPKFHIFTKIIVFKNICNSLDHVLHSLYILWQGHVRNTLFFFIFASCEPLSMISGPLALYQLQLWLTFHHNSAQFQITVLVHFDLVWFWLVTVLLIVWPQSLSLCPFHKKLRIWWKKSFCFCQTDNPLFSCIMYSYGYRQLTSKNLGVSEFSTLRMSTKRKSLEMREIWLFHCKSLDISTPR